ALGRGDALIFPSFIMHRALPVQSGYPLDAGLLADRSRTPQMIAQTANAVSDDDCRLLTKIYDCEAPLAKVRDYTGHPVVYWEQLRDMPSAGEIVLHLVEECLCTIRIQLQLEEPLYPETVILAALGAGGHHSRHADNCRQNEKGEWIANH